MSQIDPTRLTQILSALGAQKGARIDTPPDQANNTPANRGTKMSRSTAALRSRLKTRLRDNQQRDDYLEAAPALAIQEILCWEFGDEVMEHPDFERIAKQVTTTIIANTQLGQAMALLINEITNEG